MSEEQKTVWNKEILDQMREGAVTFSWDDGEIMTISAPEGTLNEMRTAWEWIETQLNEFKKGKGRPRTICLRLKTGQFRGLRFPDGVPGDM